jgi:ATP-binding cassette subfamily F protein 3
VATDVLDMRKDGITHYEGDYDDYLAEQAKRAATVAAGQQDNPAGSTPASQPSKGKQSYQQSKETQKARRKLQRQVDKLEAEMTDLEAKQEEIQEKMSQPEIATDIGKLTDLQKELDAAKEKSDEVELAWTEAAEKLEEFDQENQ